jgi:hypothetical protein
VKAPPCKIGASYYSPLWKRGARGDFDVLFDIAIFLPDNTGICSDYRKMLSLIEISIVLDGKTVTIWEVAGRCFF